MWYVIWTATGKEEICKTQIENVCSESSYIRVVIPKKKVSRKIKGLRQYVEVKLFPSYVLVETDEVELLDEELRNIVGFTRILNHEGSFKALDKKEADMISRLIGDRDSVEESIGYIEGDRIVITEGPMVGMESQIRYIDRHKRIAFIEIELFDRLTEVKVPLEIVDKV